MYVCVCVYAYLHIRMYYILHTYIQRRRSLRARDYRFPLRFPEETHHHRRESATRNRRGHHRHRAIRVYPKGGGGRLVIINIIAFRTAVRNERCSVRG